MDGLILPKQKIIGGNIIGYTMDYVNGSYINKLNLTNQELIQLFKKISSLLKHYHRYGIVLADINISNILVKSLDEVYFCDVDSCKIVDLPHENIPFLTYHFLEQLKIKYMSIDENFDRLSLYLLFLYIMLDKQNILLMSQYELDKKLAKTGLEKQKVFIKTIKKNLGEIPYLEELL